MNVVAEVDAPVARVEESPRGPRRVAPRRRVCTKRRLADNSLGS